MRGGTTYRLLGNGCGKSLGLLTLEILYFFFAAGEEAKINPDPVLSAQLMTTNSVVNGSKFLSIHSTLDSDR